jgi:hypothetical protein
MMTGGKACCLNYERPKRKQRKKRLKPWPSEGAKGAARAAEFDKQQETLRGAIEKAEAANQNALDALMRGDRD